MADIVKKRAKIAVMGLGYVGLPLAIEFARAGFNVTGIDPDKRKSKAILAGRTYITDISGDDIKKVVSQGFLNATSDFAALEDMDVVFICVPTPFTKAKEPDVSFVISATRTIRRSTGSALRTANPCATSPSTRTVTVLG